MIRNLFYLVMNYLDHNLFFFVYVCLLFNINDLISVKRKEIVQCRRLEVKNYCKYRQIPVYLSS